MQEERSPKLLSGALLLKEKGRVFRSWKKAYVELYPDTCRIYRSQHDIDPIITFSLVQCCVTYSNTGAHEERMRTLEVQSGNEIYSIQAESAASAKQWCVALREHAKLLDAELMKQLQVPVRNEGFENKICKMGWLLVRLTSAWRWRYVVLTDHDLLVYDRAPNVSETLLQYALKIPLYESRLRELKSSELRMEDEIKFALAIISPKETAFLATETRTDLRNWLNAIKSMSIKAIIRIEDFTFPVFFNDEECTLILRRSFGFLIRSVADETVRVQMPFHQFRQFQWDGDSFVLDFGEFRESVRLLTKEGVRISLLISQFIDALILLNDDSIDNKSRSMRASRVFSVNISATN